MSRETGSHCCGRRPGPGGHKTDSSAGTRLLCVHLTLTEDGTAVADEPQGIWRLPSREEVVRSLTRGGRNAGGTWDPQRERPSYDRRPDKESPLWVPYAPAHLLVDS